MVEKAKRGMGRDAILSNREGEHIEAVPNGVGTDVNNPFIELLPTSVGPGFEETFTHLLPLSLQASVE